MIPDRSEAPDQFASVGRRTRWRSLAGAGVTIVYLIWFAAYLVRNWTHVVDLDANAMGDMLAGVFAPLAFLWLVLGFLQQGDELRNNVEALLLQAKELNASVSHQAELALATRDQIKIEERKLEEAERESLRAAQPIFSLRPVSSTSGVAGRSFEFEVFNIGASCSKVTLIFESVGNVFRAPIFASQTKQTFRVEIRHEQFHDMDARFDYLDARGDGGTKFFRLTERQGWLHPEPI